METATGPTAFPFPHYVCVHVHTWVCLPAFGVLVCPLHGSSCCFPELLTRPVGVLKYGCVRFISVAMSKIPDKKQRKEKSVVMSQLQVSGEIKRSSNRVYS